MKIGLLGMPDNQNTPYFVEALRRHCPEDQIIVVHWRPALRDQLKRVVRKLKNAGIAATIQRITYALLAKLKLKQQRSLATVKVATPNSQAIQYYNVSHHNSEQCAKILEENQVEVLVLCTDAILSNKILKVPKIVTLNAHPGWIPQFRGIGSLFFMLQAGLLPAVTIHAVDAGVDTGPVILRRQMNVDSKIGVKAILDFVLELRVKLLLEALAIIRSGNLNFIDTFSEPSSMTKGMPLADLEALDRRLKSGELILKPHPLHIGKLDTSFKVTNKCAA